MSDINLEFVEYLFNFPFHLLLKKYSPSKIRLPFQSYSLPFPFFSPSKYPPSKNKFPSS